MEQQVQPTKDGQPVPVAVLNLWCTEGMRAVKLGEIQRLRFMNPVIENEMRRALETLARSHDSQKKAVSLHFLGWAKRKVEVGYVVENPIWKTSYRLVLKEGKPYLQGWAVVENPTDEDWVQVTMALFQGGRSRSRWTCTTRCTLAGRRSSRSCSPRCARPPIAG
ncbi:MAG TPA: hypothetical protein VKE40_27590 [Gemmataceae bacterium]|nr:hypothetical protein [Gemmataceae bacterium]